MSETFEQVIHNQQNQWKRGAGILRVKRFTVTEEQTADGVEYLVRIENSDLLETTLVIPAEEPETGGELASDMGTDSRYR